MKRRSVEPDDGLDPSGALCQAFARLRDAGEVQSFLTDLCTPAEIEAMADRWRVIPWLVRGVPYREIHDHTGVSVTTIGRVARCLEGGAGGYRLAMPGSPRAAKPALRSAKRATLASTQASGSGR